MASQVVLLKKDKHFGHFGSQTCTKPLGGAGTSSQLPARPAPAPNTRPGSRPPRFLLPGSSTRAAHGEPQEQHGAELDVPLSPHQSSDPSPFPCFSWGELTLLTTARARDSGAGFPAKPRTALQSVGFAAAAVSLQAWVRTPAKGNPPVLGTGPLESTQNCWDQ